MHVGVTSHTGMHPGTSGIITSGEKDPEASLLNILTDTDDTHLWVLMIFFAGATNPQGHQLYASLVLQIYLKA